MGLGQRLYRILRAQAGHYRRQATERWSRSEEAVDPNYDDLHAHASHKETRRPSPASSSDTDPISRAYKLLELSYGSDARAVRTAHRRLLSRYHPDRFARDAGSLADATRLTQELTSARDLLLRAIEEGTVRRRTP